VGTGENKKEAKAGVRIGTLPIYGTHHHGEDIKKGKIEEEGVTEKEAREKGNGYPHSPEIV